MPKKPCPHCKTSSKPSNVRTTRTLATEYECSHCDKTIARSGLGAIVTCIGALLNFALVLFGDSYWHSESLIAGCLYVAAWICIGLGFYLMRPKIKASRTSPTTISDQRY